MGTIHLNCTTEKRREEICRLYTVHADDCIQLYGGDTIISDANHRIIRDKYYQFSCVSKANHKDKRAIICGAGAARHLCKLINEPMPHFCSVFTNLEDSNDSGNKISFNGEDGQESTCWNNIRKQFYFAVQVFITRYRKTLQPGTKIFKLSQSIYNNYQNVEPQKFHVEDFVSIVDAYKTNIPKCVEELSRYGAIRSHDFNILEEFLRDKYKMEDNIFMLSHNN